MTHKKPDNHERPFQPRPFFYAEPYKGCEHLEPKIPVVDLPEPNSKFPIRRLTLRD